MTIDRHPDPAAAVAKTNRYMSGCDGGKEIDLRRWHVDRPVQLYGSLADIDGAQISFSPDLSRNLDDADASYLDIRAQIDAYIARIGIDAPAAPPYVRVWSPEADPTTLDAAAAGITSVLWCIGFRPDYGWIEVDVFDDRGRPVYRRGERAAPGMHFIGLGWLGAWGSGRFLGIDQDAGYLAGRIEAQLSQAPRVAAAGAR
jgi:putative flavoprotein involved in K+ transport